MARTLLREHHVFDFTRRELQVGALLVCHKTDGQIAARLRISPLTVRRHLAGLEHKIFDGMPLPPSRVGVALYIDDHEQCCTRACAEMIRNDQFD